MSSLFTQIVLFGYSPLFVDISQLALRFGLDLLIICGDRNRDEISSLPLPSSCKVKVLSSISPQLILEAGFHQDCSLGLSFGSPFIFDQDCIDLFNGRLLNSHGSPLPEYKGGGGFTWRILQGDMRGACLLHLVSVNIDEGPVVFRKDFVFDDTHRFPRDFLKTQYLFELKYLIPFISSLLSSGITSSLLSNSSPCSSTPPVETYFPRLFTDLHGAIDWNLSASDIEKFICAFSYPYPGAFSFINRTKIRLYDCSLARTASNHPFLSGLVTYLDSHYIEVAVNDGFLRISLSDISHSNIRFSVGMRFHTDPALIQESKSSRVSYTPDGHRFLG